MTEVTFLGKTLKGDEGRDAIHIAVAPAKAGQRLHPGQHVRISKESGVRIAHAADMGGPGAIGIVDPFLPHSLDEGELFYICLYPYSITSLRHVWTHPEFEDDEGCISELADPVEVSKEWIRNFGEPLGVTYQSMIDAAKEWIEEGEYFCRGGDFEGARVPDEFWIHYERATGETVLEKDKSSFFTCAC